MYVVRVLSGGKRKEIDRGRFKYGRRGGWGWSGVLGGIRMNAWGFNIVVAFWVENFGMRGRWWMRGARQEVNAMYVLYSLYYSVRRH